MLLNAAFQAKPMTLNQAPDFTVEDTFDAMPGGRPRGVMLHRSDAVAARPDIFAANTPADIRKYYQTLDPSWRMPFALHIAQDGLVTQCASLDRQTPHARSGNATHVGVCCVDYFRLQEGQDMPAAQLGALVGLCAHLVQCGFLEADDSKWLVSHDGDPAYSSIPHLESPGGRLPVKELKSLVQGQLLHAVEGVSLRLSMNSDVRSDELAGRTRAVKEKLQQGHLQEAFAELEQLRQVAGAAEPRAKLMFSMARAKQFVGSEAMQ